MADCLNDFAAVKTTNATVFSGSNLDVLPFMADNSVDAIVTDPPYELGFMGKSWDSSGIAYSVELWQECLRVLKPGGHLLAFGGSRTWHRIAVAIEDAGFDVRDSIAWLYGSGFPKSHDISKGIDKAAPRAGLFEGFAKHYAESRKKQKLSHNAICEVGKFYGNTNHGGASSNWETGANVPTLEQWKVLQPLLNLSLDWLPLIERVEAEREVIGQVESNSYSFAPGQNNNVTATILDITAPATDEAKKWQGWGTALKPAFEPVVVARKPLVGTVAANVLVWGVGGLNIDASRIGRAEGDVSAAGNRTATFGTQDTQSGGDGSGGWEQNSGGRWPANIILDPYTAELLDEQSGEGVSKSGGMSGRTSAFVYGKHKSTSRTGHDDKGGASRFFYVAKASKRDRNEGLEELEDKVASKFDGGLIPDWRGIDNRAVVAKNFHPTVKPTELMRYLIKLVTPGGGVVLDPFTGSGSTGKAALLDGYQFLGIELTDDYLPIIQGRLEWAEAEAVRVAQAAAEEEESRLF